MSEDPPYVAQDDSETEVARGQPDETTALAEALGFEVLEDDPAIKLPQSEEVLEHARNKARQRLTKNSFVVRVGTKWEETDPDKESEPEEIVFYSGLAQMIKTGVELVLDTAEEEPLSQEQAETVIQLLEGSGVDPIIIEALRGLSLDELIAIFDKATRMDEEEIEPEYSESDGGSNDIPQEESRPVRSVFNNERPISDVEPTLPQMMTVDEFIASLPLNKPPKAPPPRDHSPENKPIPPDETKFEKEDIVQGIIDGKMEKGCEVIGFRNGTDGSIWAIIFKDGWEPFPVEESLLQYWQSVPQDADVSTLPGKDLWQQHQAPYVKDPRGHSLRNLEYTR